MLLYHELLELALASPGAGVVVTGAEVVVTGVGVFVITGMGVFATVGAAFKLNSRSSIQKSP